MTLRPPIATSIIALGLFCSVTFAQDEGEAAPSILESEPAVSESVDAETDPQMESTLPAEESATEQSLHTVPVRESGTVLTMPEAAAAPAPPISLPTHGMKMTEVERRYGAPISREPAVGNPPITRWNYDGFSVFFEYSTVLHAVQKDRPAEIYRKEELLPASSP